MKKFLFFLIVLSLFNTASISHSQVNDHHDNYPAGVCGIISAQGIRQAPAPFQADQLKMSRKWEFHNPKLGHRLNKKINQVISKASYQPADDSYANNLRRDDKTLNICVQVECAVHDLSRCAAATKKILKQENSLIRDRIRHKIESYGGLTTGYNCDKSKLQALIPLKSVDSLANLAEVNFIRLPIPATAFDNITTEALDDINADNWQAFGINGQNIRIGIIDVGFRGYRSLQGTELPTTVTGKNFVDGQTDDQLDDPSVSPHGTACAEVIHDIAPAAAIYIAKVWSEIDLNEAVTWMQDNQIDIISTSIGWYNLTPGDGTGELADIVNRAHNAGILWVTAAGNDRQRHWGGPFSDLDKDRLDFAPERNINFFGPGDGSGAYLIEPGHTYTIYVRWSDWQNYDQDYDVYVYRWDENNLDENDPNNHWGNPIAYSYDFQDGTPGQTPTEAVEFTTSGDATAYGFIIRHSIPVTREVNFEIFAPNAPRFDIMTSARSLANLADVAQAVTVSAIDRDSYIVMPYSAMGPTNGPGGSQYGGFNKPELAGYTNVTTASYGLFQFNGTSAATPHVAGTAALILSQNTAFNPDQLKASLIDQAIDIETSGFDFATGWGRLHLDSQSNVYNTWLGYSIFWQDLNNWSNKIIPDRQSRATIPATPAGGNQPLISGYYTSALQLTISGTLTIESNLLTIGN